MAGRPRKFTPKELQARIDAYFVAHPGRETISGLCLDLDIDRDTMLAWAHEKTIYSGIAKKAINRIAFTHEENLKNAKGGQATGSIFWLKCHKWNDGNNLRMEASATKTTDGIKVTISNSSGATGIDV